MTKLFLLALVCFLAGCANTADIVRELGNDKANACISISTIYGTVALGRTNTQGTSVNVSSGTCSMESSAAP